MTFGLGRRSRRLAVLAAALFVLAGGIAYATIPDAGQTYTACVLKGVGTIRLIDTSLSGNSLLGRCSSLETQVTWNQKGQAGPAGPAGAAGQSPTVAQLASGDANCPAGGAAITGANGSTAYVCNGTNGANGQPFSGTFTSPNGEYSISVADTGITIQHGNHTRIVLAGDDLTLRAFSDIDAQAGEALDLSSGAGLTATGGSGLTLKSNANFGIQAGANLTLSSAGSTTVGGSAVRLGGGSCLPAARLGDPVANDVIASGSPSVCVGG
jgi:hypothetical protein